LSDQAGGFFLKFKTLYIYKMHWLLWLPGYQPLKTLINQR